VRPSDLALLQRVQTQMVDAPRARSQKGHQGQEVPLRHRGHVDSVGMRARPSFPTFSTYPSAELDGRSRRWSSRHRRHQRFENIPHEHRDLPLGPAAAAHFQNSRGDPARDQEQFRDLRQGFGGGFSPEKRPDFGGEPINRANENNFHDCGHFLTT
jgi:hypothetical protein